MHKNMELLIYIYTYFIYPYLERHIIGFCQNIIFKTYNIRLHLIHVKTLFKAYSFERIF